MKRGNSCPFENSEGHNLWLCGNKNKEDMLLQKNHEL